MNLQTIATSVAPEVIIEEVSGSLQVKGWERPEVVVKANPNDLRLEEEDDTVRMSCQGSCAVRLPQGANVHLEVVHGEARFKFLEDQLTIEQVDGALIVRNMAEVKAGQVNGELYARRLRGDLQVEAVSGNAIVRDVQGECRLGLVQGNLELRDVDSNIRANVQGNANIRLSIMNGDTYEIHAEGNIHCRIPEDAGLRLTLSSQAQQIQVKLPAETKKLSQDQCELTMGDGTAAMTLSAGGTIFLASQPAGWGREDEPEGDFAAGFLDGTTDFSDQITRQVDAQMEAVSRQISEQMERLSSAIGTAGLSEEDSERIMQRARESSERASQRAQEKMRRAQERLERKLEQNRRRAEEKAQAAERRAKARGGRGSWSFDFSSPPPAPQKDAVSDEERLLILRMLEQKKITMEEAEQLLAALEGKD